MDRGAINGLRPGDRVYRWVWTGGSSSDIQELTVVRINRVTVTVDSVSHGRFRVPHHMIDGRADWEPAMSINESDDSR